MGPAEDENVALQLAESPKGEPRFAVGGTGRIVGITRTLDDAMKIANVQAKKGSYLQISTELADAMNKYGNEFIAEGDHY